MSERPTVGAVEPIVTTRCHWTDCPHGERCVHAKGPDGRTEKEG